MAAQRAQHIAVIVTGFREARPWQGGAGKAFLGLVKTSEIAKHIAAIIEALGMAGLEGECAVETRQRIRRCDLALRKAMPRL